MTVAVVMSSQVCGVWRTPPSHCMGILKKKKCAWLKKRRLSVHWKYFHAEGNSLCPTFWQTEQLWPPV